MLLTNTLIERFSNRKGIEGRLIMEERIEDSNIEQKANILVVEDDEALNRLIQINLQRAEFHVESALNGAEAIAKVVENRNVILLLDYLLPDMTSGEVIETLDKKGLSVPFIIMTGHGDEKIAVEMMKLGASDYIVKTPSFIDILPQVVKKVSEELNKEERLDRTEEALRESEEMYRTLLATSPDAVTVSDLEGNLTHISQQTLGIHGFSSAEEMLGRNAFELIAPEDRERAMTNLQKTLTEGVVRNLEYTLLRKDGTPLTVN